MPARTLVLLGIALLSGCSDGTGPVRPGDIDLDVIFAPPTQAEIEAVEAEWDARQPGARAVQEVASSTVLTAGGFGTLRVYAHEVDGNRHYGATVVPVGASPRSLPIVVVAHGGDVGINVNDVLLMLVLMGPSARDFVYVIPSFRSEPLTFGGTTFTSEGEASPWDRDVDDALALIDVVRQRTPEADPERIGVIGLSRGGLVALLMAIRDSRIDRVAVVAGPTDFFDSWIREITGEILEGGSSTLPGVRVLASRFIEPLKDGNLAPAAFRRELVRRSAVLWADRLPPVQIHHGTLDDVVPVGQAESLRDALAGLDRVGVGDEVFIYPGGRHDILGLTGIEQRLVAFVGRL